MNDNESIHFVTGKLAESALREIVHDLSAKLGFHYSIDVLPITVAALMTPRWLLKHIRVPEKTTRVILPGYLDEGLEQIRASLPIQANIECGPKDVRDLPVLFGKKRFKGEDYGEYAIENHCGNQLCQPNESRRTGSLCKKTLQRRSGSNRSRFATQPVDGRTLPRPSALLLTKVSSFDRHL